MEVLCKTVTGILNCRREALIQFHDMLHRFITERGTGTVSLEAKLPQQLMYIQEKVLCKTLSDIHKAYDHLVRGCCLDILVA